MHGCVIGMHALHRPKPGLSVKRSVGYAWPDRREQRGTAKAMSGTLTEDRVSKSFRRTYNHYDAVETCRVWWSTGIDLQLLNSHLMDPGRQQKQSSCSCSVPVRGTTDSLLPLLHKYYACDQHSAMSCTVSCSGPCPRALPQSSCEYP